VLNAFTITAFLHEKTIHLALFCLSLLVRPVSNTLQAVFFWSLTDFFYKRPKFFDKILFINASHLLIFCKIAKYQKLLSFKNIVVAFSAFLIKTN